MKTPNHGGRCCRTMIRALVALARKTRSVSSVGAMDRVVELPDLPEGGDIVATQAARFYDFADTNLHEEATTLRLFYPDPTRMCRPGETCTITAPSAKGITGRVAFSGAAWYRPDFRGRELSSLLPPIGRAYAHAIWNTDCTFTFIAKALVDNGAWRRAG